MTALMTACPYCHGSGQARSIHPSDRLRYAQWCMDNRRLASFVPGSRCEVCEGEGRTEVDGW